MEPSSIQILKNAGNTNISHSPFTIQTNVNHFTSGEPFDRLQMAAAPNALHNSASRFDPPKCHPNTRVAVLDRLMDWILGKFEPETIVMWLYGPVGAGKSAIAQTLAERCLARGLLLGAFIFSRTDPTRNKIGPLAATLTYQIAVLDQQLRSLIEDAVAANPLIFSLSLETQLLKLFVTPLLTFLDQTTNTPPFPPLIIIDGLDECLDATAQCYFINVVSDLLHEQQRLPIKFLIASRPEQHLVIEFNSGTISNILARLALDDSWRPDADIYLYLEETFKEIKRRHPLRQSIPPSWPSPNTIQELMRKSSGQFIHAVTVSKFVSSIRHQPMKRLDIILGLTPSKPTDMPFAQLDALYMHIFEMVTDAEMALNIMGTIMFEVILDTSIHGVASLLFYDVSDVRLCLCELASAVDCSEQGNLTILHASLADFFLDPMRSQQFQINRGFFYAYVSRMCVRHIVEDDDKFVTGYAYAWLPVYYSWSAQTPELLEAIRGLDIEAIHNSSTSISPSQGFKILQSRSLLGRLLTVVKSAGPKELYAHLLERVDCLILRLLGDYTSLDKILLLSTLLGITDIRETGQIPPYGLNSPLMQICDPLAKSALFGIEPDVSSFDTGQGLRLLFDGTAGTEHANVLREFFTDPSRSGKYALDSQRYTSAVIAILSWIIHQGGLPDKNREFQAETQSAVDLCVSSIPALLRKCPKSDDIISYARGSDLFTAFDKMHGLFGTRSLSIDESLKEYLLRVDPQNTERESLLTK